MSPVDRPSHSATQCVELTVAQRFGVLWDALADVLGTAATATILRRAMRAAADRAALHGLTVERDGFSFGYSVPDCWQAAHGGKPLEALMAVIDELRPLLVELTGSVVVRRLERLGIFEPLGARNLTEQRSVRGVRR
jgi:hypothetical protein